VRVCTVCPLPERDRIDAMLVQGQSLRAVAAVAGVGPNAIQRHKAKCLVQRLVAASETAEALVNGTAKRDKTRTQKPPVTEAPSSTVPESDPETKTVQNGTAIVPDDATDRFTLDPIVAHQVGRMVSASDMLDRVEDRLQDVDRIRMKAEAYGDWAAALRGVKEYRETAAFVGKGKGWVVDAPTTVIDARKLQIQVLEKLSLDELRQLAAEAQDDGVS
jgi:hypothetical protein